MGEIKFRCWDTDNNKFIWTGFENFISETHEDKPMDTRKGTMVLNSNFWGLGARCEFQQFIGVRDIHNIELCVGDIFDIQQTINGQSKFFIHSCLPTIDVRYAHDTSRKYEYDIAELLDIDKTETDIEVIGNQYENPELLNQK